MKPLKGASATDKEFTVASCSTYAFVASDGLMNRESFPLAADEQHTRLMRNSLLPVVLLILTTAFAWWLIRDGAERGAGGPNVLPGIVRPLVKSSQQTLPADLQGDTSHTGNVPEDSGTWRVILIAGEDTHPFTNAAILALGEELTRRGCVAVLYPVLRDRPEPLPLSFDGVVRIAHLAGEPPAERPGTVAYSLSVTLVPVRVPADHPAARWFPDQLASSTSTVKVTHGSTPVGATSWPHWYAGVGKACATEIIRACGTPDMANDTIARLHRTSWTLPGQAGPGTADTPVSIYGRIPSPPQTDIAEHVVAFQHPFVRGWIGDFSPVPITARDQSTRSTREELIHRLQRGGWIKGPDLPTAEVFSKEDRATDGSEIHRTISISATGFIEWQERPSPTKVWRAWVDAAAAGDDVAKAQLARHRTTVGIPAELK